MRKDTFTVVPFYSDVYKTEVFYTWYSLHKPKPSRLLGMIEPNEDGDLPKVNTLSQWIYKDFKPRAQKLDEKVDNQLQEIAIKDKIEMLERHAELAKEMQDLAVEYLKNKKDDLNPQSAVRLWVEGVKIERESRGLPSLITQISEATDDDLEKMIDKLLSEVENQEELPEEVEIDTG